MKKHTVYNGKLEKKILLYLARKPNKLIQPLSTEINHDYKSVHKAVKSLHRKELLTHVPGESERGVPYNAYRLSKTGAILVLLDEEVWRDIDTVARNYPNELPLIFGKWDFFIEKGVRNTIVARLQAAVAALSMQLGKEWYIILGRSPEETIKILIEKVGPENIQKLGREFVERILWRTKRMVGDLTNSVLGSAVYLYPEDGNIVRHIKEQRDLMKKLSEDPDIDRYYKSQYKFWESYLANLVASVRTEKQWYESLG